ncbi:MAG: aminotransferase class I/II-fold pyridoxal phosphate-dependent enzyme [Defluviitaleaceae bacterium]|nr:aminotransferase class I/II-fold pyridoxal phosphate-dependent enzyme [Defluviitaleaceae bacterium]
MYEYSHGGNACHENSGKKILDLSASVNPLGMPPGVSEAAAEAAARCGSYPDNFSSQLREKISAFENVPADWIFCGGGASDIIFRLPKAVRAKKVMVAAPTFSDYERSACAAGSAIAVYNMPRSLRAGKNFAEAVANERPGLVYLCNPNNPTGFLTCRKTQWLLLDACANVGAVLAADECFMDFAADANIYTAKIFLRECPQLVIVKAFTKIFAMPGIRLGYAICSNRQTVDGLYAAGADWPVSNLAQAAGVAALADAENFIAQTKAYIKSERGKTEKRLRRLGFEVFCSKANFIFLRNPHPFDLREELLQKGIAVRSCANFKNLGLDYCRIAVSTEENNNKLISETEKIIGERL